MNRSKFYNNIRSAFFNGNLSQQQVAGTEAILNEWQKSGYKDLRWLAYMLATVYHETATTMYPIEEYGKGRGRVYGKKIRMDRKPYTTPDKIYYGRGYVQLTWFENYERMGKLLNLPLLNQPELLLNPDISARVMFEGMTKGKSLRGDFTGKSLENYFYESKEDWRNARRIINGLDKADLIAGYGRKFLRCIQNANLTILG